MRISFRLAALAALLPAVASAATLIHAGRLIDGVGNSPRERITIVVDGDHIRSIDSGFAAPGSGDEVVDLSGATVLPGFMDMHVHLTGEQSRTSELDSFKNGEADDAYDSVVYAERTLMAGFTTVRNLGDQWNVSIALRRAIAAGKVKGPRIFTAGRAIGTTGGHADASNSWGAYLSSDDPRLNTVCNGPDSCREAVRQRYKDGADSIKITATGGVLDREIRQRAAVHRRGDRRDRLDRPRLWHEGRGARAWRRGHQARRPERRGLHRARDLHGRRVHPAHEGARYALRADDLRRPLRL
jgi:imidazolonepropionase-like amidohydrolase